MSDSQKIDRVDSIDEARVRHVAMLSRLALTDDQVAQASKELTGVIKHINKLSELDLAGVPPTSHSIPMVNVFREDREHASLTNEQVLANAPESEEHCFKVPQII